MIRLTQKDATSVKMIATDTAGQMVKAIATEGRTAGKPPKELDSDFEGSGEDRSSAILEGLDHPTVCGDSELDVDDRRQKKHLPKL